MENENLEQPLTDSKHSDETGLKNFECSTEPGGSMLGKFDSAKSLYEAYTNLEAEFTRKSQKLAEFQQKIDEFAVFPKFENVDEFIKSTTDSDKYKKDIMEILSENDELNNLPNKYQVAFLIAKKADDKSAKNLTDPEFLDKNIYSNDAIKQSIISSYLSGLNNISTAPKVIGGNSANIHFSPENKPTTIKEAGEIFSKLLK